MPVYATTDNNNKSKKNKKKKKTNNGWINKTIGMLNNSQRKALLDIIQDLTNTQPTTRLLYGDVGSGKTVVALAAAFFCQSIMGGQAAIMCPTAALARQHYETANVIMGRDPKDDGEETLAIVLSQQKKAERQKHRIDRVHKGERGIIIGTHALANCAFGNLRFVIIDEQQKFGTDIRKVLTDKIRGKNKSVLLLTATPIPRTIAQIVQNSIQEGTPSDTVTDGNSGTTISCIEGRKRQQKTKHTTILYGPKHPDTVRHIWNATKTHSVDNKGITILVAPCIDTNNEQLVDCMWILDNMLSEESRKKFGFDPDRVATLHGRMKQREKLNAVDKLKSGEKNILITTSIVEVGMHVDGANLIVIFQCDRFGMASLYQLQGRVGRNQRGDGLPDASCIFVAPERKKMNRKTLIRTRKIALTCQTKKAAKDPGSGKRCSGPPQENTGEDEQGMTLAIHDAHLRGPGDLCGTKQHGYTELNRQETKDDEEIPTTPEPLEPQPESDRRDKKKKKAKRKNAGRSGGSRKKSKPQSTADTCP